jgi:hypothetical protein
LSLGHAFVLKSAVGFRAISISTNPINQIVAPGGTATTDFGGPTMMGH